MPKTLTEAADAYVARYTEKIEDPALRPLRGGYKAQREEVRADFLAGANWMREQFKLLGSDACSECDTGRSTIYVTLDGLCIECHHAKEREGK